MQPWRAKTKTHRRGVTMRFMMMVKHAESQGPPPKGFMDVMAKLGEDAVKAGTMVISGGLAATAASTRVRLTKGQINAIDGPFTEAKEVVGGFAILEYKSKKEALEGALAFMELHKKHWPGWECETGVPEMFDSDGVPPKA